GRVAEAALCLGARHGEGLVEVALAEDAPDAAAAAAGAGLDDEGEAEPARMLARLLDRRDRTAAPGRDRHPDLLRDPLGRDLVAEAAHGVAGRPDEGDAELGAEVCERGVLGDEAPADPGRVGARAAQRIAEPLEVEVGAGGAEVKALVGLADE